MTKPAKAILLTIAVVVCAGLATIPLLANANKGSQVMEKERIIPPIDAAAPEVTETATFALGWFWGPDARFGSIKGVISTRVGYAGGTTGNPEYYRLGDHSETVQIEYDPAQISYQDLLNVFWHSHNPTMDPRSYQYKSIIFYHNDEQKRLATESKEHREAEIERKIFTEMVPAPEFYLAEEYHQKYYLQDIPELVNEFRAIYPDFNDFINSTAAARVNGYAAGYGTKAALQEELYDLGLSPEGTNKVLDIADRPLVPGCTLPQATTTTP
jgi:peptide-methionine (S)-S-oxide reductase